MWGTLPSQNLKGERNYWREEELLLNLEVRDQSGGAVVGVCLALGLSRTDLGSIPGIPYGP